MRLLHFNVVLWIPDFDEKFFNAVAVVALQHDFAVFAGSSACAVGFEFLGDALQVTVFVVHAVDYGGCFAEFSCFKAYANPLLLFLYFSTNA